MLDLGVPQDRIIYANPCKQASHLKYAAKHNVATMAFDNEVELHKVCMGRVNVAFSWHHVHVEMWLLVGIMFM